MGIAGQGLTFSANNAMKYLLVLCVFALEAAIIDRLSGFEPPSVLFLGACATVLTVYLFQRFAPDKTNPERR